MILFLPARYLFYFWQNSHLVGSSSKEHRNHRWIKRRVRFWLPDRTFEKWSKPMTWFCFFPCHFLFTDAVFRCPSFIYADLLQIHLHWWKSLLFYEWLQVDVNGDILFKSSSIYLLDNRPLVNLSRKLNFIVAIGGVWWCKDFFVWCWLLRITCFSFNSPGVMFRNPGLPH